MTSSSENQQVEWPEKRTLAKGRGGRVQLVEGESPARLDDLKRHGFELQTYVPATQQSGDGLVRALEEIDTPAPEDEPTIADLLANSERRREIARHALAIHRASGGGPKASGLEAVPRADVAGRAPRTLPPIIRPERQVGAMTTNRAPEETVHGIARALARNAVREWSGAWDRDEASVDRLIDEIVGLGASALRQQWQDELLSDEAVEAGTKTLLGGMEPGEFNGPTRDEAREVLQAALAATQKGRE